MPSIVLRHCWNVFVGDEADQYCDIEPLGCTLQYASPEQIRSLQLRHEWEYEVSTPCSDEHAAATSGGRGVKSVVRKVKQAWKERQLAIAEQRRIDAFYDRLKGCPVTGGLYTNIDGASADNYAAGVVLYEMVSVLVFSTFSSQSACATGLKGSSA